MPGYPSARLVLFLSLVGYAAATSRVSAQFTSGPWPPAFGYHWSGIDGQGSGSVSDWANSWTGGRYIIVGDGVNPPVVTWLPAEDGDTLVFSDSFIEPDGPYSINGGVSLPSSHMGFGINATFGGGSFEANTVEIQNRSFKVDHAGFFPQLFNGTSFQANTSLRAGAVHHAVIFSGSTIESPLIDLNAVWAEIPEAPSAGIPTLWLIGGTEVSGSTIKIAQGPDIRATRIGVSESSLESLAVEIGYDQEDMEEGAARLQLMNLSEANFMQSVVVGKTGRGELLLESESTLLSPSANGVIGEDGRGTFRISGNSRAELDELIVALRAQADLAIDTDGELTTTDGIVGAVAGFEGTVNLETGGTWETDTLVAGRAGIARFYVRNGGTLKINDSAILGEEASGQGYLNLIGSGSTLELAEGATFTVGQNGYGEVNLTEGATFESEGDVTLAPLATSDSTVNIDGAGSRWDTSGKLTIGDLGTGEVELRNGGILNLSDETIVGKETGSHGYLRLIGANSKVELGEDATLQIGGKGTGELNLYQGASFVSQGTVNLGHEAEGRSIVRIDGADTKWEVIGFLHIGEKGKGEIHLTGGGTLTAEGGDMIIGLEQDSEGILSIQDAASKIDFEGDVNVGYHGTGMFDIKMGAEVTADNITLGNFEDSDGKITITNTASKLTTDQLFVGRGGRGQIDVTLFGKLISQGDVIMAHDDTSGTEDEPSYVYVGGNAEWTVEQDLTIGKGGTALVTIEENAQFKTAGNVILGEEQGSKGQIDFASHDFAWEPAGDLTIGKAGEGTIQVTGGHVNVAAGLVIIAQEQNSTGTLLIQGDEQGNKSPTVSLDGQLRVGDHGTGKVSVDGNGGSAYLDVDGILEVGVDSQGDGTLEVKNAARVQAENFYIGGEGKGVVEITGEGEISSIGQNGEVIIDATVQGNALVKVMSGESYTRPALLNSSSIIVGETGYGRLEISSHGRLGRKGSGGFDGDHFGTLQIATQSTSHGTVVVGDEGVALLQELEVSSDSGGGGDAELEINSGWVDVAGAATFGAAAGSGTAKLNITHSGLFGANEVNLLNRSETTIDGASIHLPTGGKVIAGGSAAAPATITIRNGGTISWHGNSGTQFRPGYQGKTIVNVESGGNVLVGNVEIGSEAGAISGTTVTVTGSNSFIQSIDAMQIHAGAILTATSDGVIAGGFRTLVDGTVDVLAGRMQIGAINLAEMVTGELQVRAGGTLTGRGLIRGTVKVQGGIDAFVGKVASGRSPGALNVEGDFIVEEGGIVEMEIGGLTPDTQHDQINVTGMTQVDGNVLLKFVNGFAPTIGQQFTLFNSDSLTIDPTIYVRNLAAGWQYQVTQSASAWVVTSLSNGVFLQTGDYNQDGAVDAADYTVWRDSLGKTGVGSAADGNDDGIVDQLDYDLWKDNFGWSAGAGALVSQSVPELPSGLLLLMATGSAGLARFRSFGFLHQRSQLPRRA